MIENIGNTNGLLARHGLGAALATLAGPRGLVASLHPGPGAPWLVVAHEDVGGGSCSATSAVDAIAACLVDNVLVAGGVVAPGADVDVQAGNLGKQPATLGKDGAWLAIVDGIAPPATITISAHARDGAVISTTRLDFCPDPKPSMRLRLYHAQQRIGRLSTSRLPRGSSTY